MSSVLPIPFGPEAYRSEAVFEAERSAIFEREPVPVCRVESLAEAGAFVAGSVAGEPLVVLRTASGAIVALSNVCRHRYATMLEGQGCAASIVCPYHRWTYDLDGRLIGAAFMEGADVFRASDVALHHFHAEVWNGWVFVSLHAPVTPLASRLAALAEALAEHRLADWRAVRTIDFPSDCNWKAMVEGFIESYHHMGVHATTLEPFWHAHESFVSHADGEYLELRHPMHEEQGTFAVYLGLPLFLLAIVEPRRAAYWYEVQIERHDRIVVRVHVMLPPEIADSAEAATEAAESIVAIHSEDQRILRNVQAGVASRFTQPTALSPLEAGVAGFQRYVRARLEAHVRQA